MRRSPNFWLTAALLVLSPACDLGGSDDDTGNSDATGDAPGGDTMGATEGTGGTGPGASEGADDESSGDPVDPGGPMVWVPVGGPCAGSGTNALWFDDANVGFVGCGENADGEGLYTTIDGGTTWESQMRFGEVRVMDIRRGPDGVLYGAGIHQLDGYSVFSIDESDPERLDPRGLYQPGTSAFSAVNQAENVAVTGDGEILIDSLTGTSCAHQPAGGEFTEYESLSEAAIADPDAPGIQVRRILAHDNSFYAVGSLINDPARVHLPSMLPDATFHFQSVELQPETRDGELLDMHIWDSTHMIVAGHDQSERYPLMYLLDGGDPYMVDSWEQIELWDSDLEYEGGYNGIAVDGDVVVGVGEKIPTSQGGFVVHSTDGGRTFVDITPEGAGALSRVFMLGNGELVVAGGGGEMWLYVSE
ncbi:MAG: hypothetical protein AAF799_25915 [Myxococcota bacterium]